MEQDKHSQYFMYIVSTFEMAAMQAMGKLKNPMTDKIEIDLTQAQFSIDVLDMLKEKTKGNLNEYENRFLDNTLGQLKLNFIDEKNKETKPEEEKK
ncbi:MAG TPA: DUF1844 domain-containing protein [Ignavibacteria bacterium]|nr:DUF1844 domain-containing protein [Ignavibacteria bacterium]